MKTILKGTENTITIDDADFNPPGWVNIRIKDEDIDIHISELYPALLAYKTKYEDER